MGARAMSEKPVLIGCGILEKEISHLVARNRWALDTAFLPSGLHIDFDRLKDSLDKCLLHYKGRRTMVFYGACHPLMDRIIEGGHTCRTPGQSCVDICLGHELFCHELENGAFFLFEDWAHHWNQIVGAAMPGNSEIMRSIFRGAHKYLLAIRTPCSGDFSAEAEAASEMTSLELRWIDVGLEHLEENLVKTFNLTSGE